MAWQRPDGTGSALRQLQLSYCQIDMPANRLLPALRQLERLELESVGPEEAQFSILPHLPHLTSLALQNMGVAWPVVLRCAGLRELAVAACADPPPAHLPPGTLPYLTRLRIGCDHASPAWLELPQLCSLELTPSG